MCAVRSGNGNIRRDAENKNLIRLPGVYALSTTKLYFSKETPLFFMHQNYIIAFSNRKIIF
jgi:hypothetical protein